MRIICKKSNLVKGVSIVSKAVPSKTTMPILECILIDATTDVIKLTANDMELGIETTIDGIIDSRESKRCPNGLCICPKCLTCCSNDFFDRMANKYLSSNRLVPQWINNRLGKGHKDLHTLFCPKCGTEFDDTHTECPSCHYK